MGNMLKPGKVNSIEAITFHATEENTLRNRVTNHTVGGVKLKVKMVIPGKLRYRDKVFSHLRGINQIFEHKRPRKSINRRGTNSTYINIWAISHNNLTRAIVGGAVSRWRWVGEVVSCTEFRIPGSMLRSLRQSLNQLNLGWVLGRSC